MFGWDGQLTLRQTAEIAAAKRVIYDAVVARSGGCAKAEGPIHLDIMEGHFVPNYPWARRSYRLSDASLVSHQFLEDPSGRSSRRPLGEILCRESVFIMTSYLAMRAAVSARRLE